MSRPHSIYLDYASTTPLDPRLRVALADEEPKTAPPAKSKKAE